MPVLLTSRAPSSSWNGCRYKGLNLHLAATELDPKMSENFCYDVNFATGQPLPPSQCPYYDAMPENTQLPIVPKFKGDATARYTFPLGGLDMQGYGQAAYSYTSSTNSSNCPLPKQPDRRVPAYGLLDLAFGVNKGSFQAELFASNALDKRAETYRFAQCTIVAPYSQHPDTTICAANRWRPS